MLRKPVFFPITPIVVSYSPAYVWGEYVDCPWGIELHAEDLEHTSRIHVSTIYDYEYRYSPEALAAWGMRFAA